MLQMATWTQSKNKITLDPAANGNCTDFRGLLTGLIGFDVSEKVDGVLGARI